MAIVVLRKGDRLTKAQYKQARGEYESYVKITADLETGVIALGGEYHADTEKILLKEGCKQENIWGGGMNLETKSFETNAIINLRPGRNDSTEILDPDKRRRFWR